MSKHLFYFAAILGVSFANCAIADTLELRDWKTAGDELLLYDSATGLEWLNLTQTTNRSWNEVNDAFANIYQGFRFASSNEAARLMIDAGVDVSLPNLPTEANYDPVTYLQSLWGITDPRTPSSHYSYYVTGTGSGAGSQWVSTGYFNAFDGNPPTGRADPTSTLVRKTFVTPTVGFALVRDVTVVPTPSSLAALIGMGVVGLCLGWRRRPSGCLSSYCEKRFSGLG